MPRHRLGQRRGDAAEALLLVAVGLARAGRASAGPAPRGRGPWPARPGTAASRSRPSAPRRQQRAPPAPSMTKATSWTPMRTTSTSEVMRPIRRPTGVAREEAHRHAQQVRVDVVAQVVDHRLAQPQREPRAEDEAELGEAPPAPGSPATPSSVPRGVVAGDRAADARAPSPRSRAAAGSRAARPARAASCAGARSGRV